MEKKMENATETRGILGSKGLNLSYYLGNAY